MAEKDTPSTAGKPKHTPQSIQIPFTCLTVERKVYTYPLIER